MRNKGFTLMEVLIAASIFAMVSTLGASIFINISKSERKTELKNALYEDARVIMETLAREIRSGTIDYEEYYSREVLDAPYYGINRGVYGSRFYHPGYYLDADGNPQIGTNPDNLGGQYIPVDGIKVFYSLSVDKNMGANPYTAEDETAQKTAGAFCDDSVPEKPCPNEQLDNFEPRSELYLISSDGRSKTILVNQLMNSEDHALSVVKMDGYDYDSNGVVDIFECASDYKQYCAPAVLNDFKYSLDIEASIDGIRLPDKHDKDTLFSLAGSAFTPISPLRSNVKDLQFIIWPDEDPYKAFAETAVQFQPSVTIILTLEPSAEEMKNYPAEENPSITIQTTVSTGTHSKIETYPPTKKLGWIDEVL